MHGLCGNIAGRRHHLFEHGGDFLKIFVGIGDETRAQHMGPGMNDIRLVAGGKNKDQAHAAQQVPHTDQGGKLVRIRRNQDADGRLAQGFSQLLIQGRQGRAESEFGPGLEPGGSNSFPKVAADDVGRCGIKQQSHGLFPLQLQSHCMTLSKKSNLHANDRMGSEPAWLDYLINNNRWFYHIIGDHPRKPDASQGMGLAAVVHHRELDVRLMEQSAQALAPDPESVIVQILLIHTVLVLFF